MLTVYPARSGQVRSYPMETLPKSGMKCAKPGAAFSSDGFCRFLRRAYPAGTAAHVAALAGCPVSTAEKWLRGETRPCAEHLGSLCAAFGPAFIAAAMPATRHWSRGRARNEEIQRIARQLAHLLAAD